jgi:shikimate dehydrogenase
MHTFGIVGFPLSHSFSQKYFTEKFQRENISDCEFKNFPLEDIHDFPALVKNNPSLCGLSVTIPHKQSVMKYLDEIDGTAKEVGAVNCIKRWQTADGRWQMEGYNTDVFGFEKSLKPLLKENNSKALILGTGGASKAVAFVLKKLNIEYVFITRNASPFHEEHHNPTMVGFKDKLFTHLEYDKVEKHVILSHPLIINTTPLGMFPNVNDCPDIPYEFLTSKHLLYDLTYNPEESLFLKKGKEKGAQIKNGLEMLHLQAEKAWEIWNSPT